MPFVRCDITGNAKMISILFPKLIEKHNKDGNNKTTKIITEKPDHIKVFSEVTDAEFKKSASVAKFKVKGLNALGVFMTLTEITKGEYEMCGLE